MLRYLTDDQKRLLFDIVEAYRKSNKQFLMLRAMPGGDWLQHPGFNGEYHMAQPDALVLREAGLLTVTHDGGYGAFHFIPSPAAFAAYEELHRQMGEPTDAVEAEVRQYFEAASFRGRHESAFESLRLAAELVWTEKADSKLSDVGHHCRVALQEFTGSLLKSMGLEPDEPNVERTRDRASQALVEARRRGLVGETMERVLDRLFDYWVALNELACRQEHGVNREPTPSDWEDARALVFHTMFVMAEFDRRLCR
jgi:hypothetical protein